MQFGGLSSNQEYAMETVAKVNLGFGDHIVVSKDEWFSAAEQLVAQEKAFTRERDKLSANRRNMPWMEITQEYLFDTPMGKKKLGELFEDKSQLIVFHFMFAPDWVEGCEGCSFVCDHVDAAVPHIESKDIKFIAISRASLATFLPFKKRMGWHFDWISSEGTTFNYDFGVSFKPDDLSAGPVYYNYREQPIRNQDQPGVTVFVKAPDGRVFRTYSTYERGEDLLMTTYNWLDLTPKGRDEDTPETNPKWFTVEPSSWPRLRPSDVTK
jgi:predicted dithiol-disulfide oxidoreductase (DUF899 family)